MNNLATLSRYEFAQKQAVSIATGAFIGYGVSDSIQGAILGAGLNLALSSRLSNKTQLLAATMFAGLKFSSSPSLANLNMNFSLPSQLVSIPSFLNLPMEWTTEKLDAIFHYRIPQVLGVCSLSSGLLMSVSGISGALTLLGNSSPRVFFLSKWKSNSKLLVTSSILLFMSTKGLNYLTNQSFGDANNLVPPLFLFMAIFYKTKLFFWAQKLESIDISEYPKIDYLRTLRHLLVTTEEEHYEVESACYSWANSKTKLKLSGINKKISTMEISHLEREIRFLDEWLRFLEENEAHDNQDPQLTPEQKNTQIQQIQRYIHQLETQLDRNPNEQERQEMEEYLKTAKTRLENLQND